MKKSIAFVLPNLNAGGAQRVVSTLSNLLIKEFHVSVIILYKNDLFYNLDPKVKLEFCSSTYQANPNIFQSVTTHFILIKNLIKILRSHKTDLIIGFLPVTNIYAILASKFLRIPSIISERANPEYSILSPFWSYIRKRGYPLSNCLVVQTQATKSYFKSYVKSNIEVINNPINLNLLLKKDFSIKKEDIILNVGRLAEPKNQDLLIRAFSNINHMGWKLILVGDGVNYDPFKNLINSLEMQEHIVLAGNSTDVASYYNKSKIFAFTSKYEGFPNVILEAMSYGLACISTNCPHGPSEIIKNNKNGLLIPVSDQHALETALTELIEKKDFREKLGKNALESTLAYQPSNIALKWSVLINKLIKN
ncbi:MAG: glycosyltransferase family 4 protein [Xanthomarina sp.]